MSAGSGVAALGLGLGPVVFLVVGVGRAIAAAGLDMQWGILNWGLVPIIEETFKLAPVAFVVWLHGRRQRFGPNPSDLLMLGCFAGAGFALAENVMWVYNNAGVATDMAWRYGPHVGGLYVVPDAWGVAGYAGHAAATGFIAGGYGLGLALHKRLHTRWWIVPAACAGWVVLEHALRNLYLISETRASLIVGNGRLTPWLFLVLSAAIVILDYRSHRAAFAKSVRLRRRVRLTWAALIRTAPPVPRSRVNAGRMFMSQLRLLNATAWAVHSRDRRAVRRTR
jgi:RsiW-degrading membrane proteinase PrsW (M82 family)